MLEDTIIAQATPQGKSGVSVIRLSGSKCLDIAKQIFLCPEFERGVKPNFMYLGKIDLGEVEDRGFVVFFKSPRSFTGEDTIEFQCHGGSAVSNRIIQQCIKHGARLAEPGEFSKRAFLNGKMSLDQAEGIIDTINAESESQLKASNDLTRGFLFERITNQQNVLTDILSEIEVNLDYPEHDIEYETKESIKAKLLVIKDELDKLLDTEQSGTFVKQGINVAIVGKTNVGKSSLLNALLNYDKAIVTDVEGTTRDVVEGKIEYKGLGFNFYDTAGIRATQDKIEEIGIEKAKSLINTSDIVVLVLDASQKLSKQDRENLNETKDKKRIIVLNKIDLSHGESFLQNSLFDGDIIVNVSAKQKVNIGELKEKIFELATGNQNFFDMFILTNARHVEIIKDARAQIESVLCNVLENPLDLTSFDIKLIWEKLGEVTGQTANETIVDKIFSKFCLGK